MGEAYDKVASICLKSFIKRLKLFCKDFVSQKLATKISRCRTKPENTSTFTSPENAPSNRIIGAGDHASVQINIAMVDEKTGRMTGDNKTYAICGKIRGMGESDDALQRLARKDGILPPST